VNLFNLISFGQKWFLFAHTLDFRAVVEQFVAMLRTLRLGSKNPRMNKNQLNFDSKPKV
jgi:hypothetical protein